MKSMWKAAWACFAMAATPAVQAQDILFIQGPPGITVTAQATAISGGVWIGVEAVPAEEVVRSQLGLKHDEGLVVVAVAPDSPAAKAKLARHDVIVQVGEKRLKEIGDLSAEVAAAGDKEIELHIIRNGEKQVIKIKPDPRPHAATLSMPVPEIPGVDRDVVLKWLEEMGPREGGMPRAMRFLHPGVVFPLGAAALSPKLPDNVSVTVTKKGSEPAKITITEGDEKWEATEDSLDKLPERARKYLGGHLPHAQMGIRVPAPGEGAISREAKPSAPATRTWVQKFDLPLDPQMQQRLEKQMKELQERLDKQMNEMRERMEEARKRVEELEQRLPRGKKKPEAE